MRARSIVLGILALSLTACASFAPSPQGANEPAPYPPSSFAHRAANSDLVLFWECVRLDPNGLRVEGVAQSPWHAQPIRYLEFELLGVDAQERLVSQASGAVRDSFISTNQMSPFRLELRTTGAEVRFDLYYQYRFVEGEEMDARLSGPPVAGLRLFAQTNRFVVRDVCSEGRHRVR